MPFKQTLQNLYALDEYATIFYKQQITQSRVDTSRPFRDLYRFKALFRYQCPNFEVVFEQDAVRKPLE